MSIENKEQNLIQISIATPEDADAITEVQYRTWLATYPNKEAGITTEDIEDRFKNRSDENKINERRERIRSQPENKRAFVAKENGKIVGFCMVSVDENANQLNSIYVLPGMQGKGVGKKLWESAENFIDQSKDTLVEVVKYNTQAIEFYRKLGFTETGREWEDEHFRLKSGAVFPEIEMRKAAIKERQN